MVLDEEQTFLFFLVLIRLQLNSQNDSADF